MSSEHLAAAEEIAAAAHQRLINGELDLARAYSDMATLHLRLAHARHTIIGNNPPPTAPAVDLPDWCGNCDGPDLGLRWVTVAGPDGTEAMRRCSTCNPYAHKNNMPHQTDQAPDAGTLSIPTMAT
ncbi:hypothetical protein ACFZAR_40910 [Streptomyces sp. NPDC008222]|uniref:hypothetical protein n=1 Tax=Streptomyces sp. NPDC008222 TaxID=3364820 RepID=UPI0036EB15D2